MLCSFVSCTAAVLPSFRLVPSCVASPSVFSLCRYITILTPEDPARAASDDLVGEEDDRIDLRTLRAIRVLRPLKLVSGVPSKNLGRARQQETGLLQ